MRTVGEILKSKRLEKKLSLEEIEEATKIRVKYLEAVEKNDFASIPGGAPITKGFIKNYAQFLSLLPTDLLAIFRRDFRESKTGQIIPQGYLEPLNRSKFSWNPKLTIFLGIFLLVISLGTYLLYQFSSYLGAPRLTVSAPTEGALVYQTEIEVLGKSDADASVFVNGDLVALDREGNFEMKLNLFPGENKIKIEAISRRGKKTELTRQVEYRPL